jgi:glycosyltransferase involved in cell wall biosynthesis
MACGTPTIATRIGGTPEIINTPNAGRLMHTRTSAALVECLNDLFSDPPSRRVVRQHAECFGWDATSQAQQGLFESIAFKDAVGDDPCAT